MEKILAEIEKNEVTCADCGCIVSMADAVEVGGELYCADCVAECYECGEMCVKSDMTYCDENGELYCSDCADTELIYCEHCDTYALDAYASRVRVSFRGATQIWCSACLDNRAYQCDECNEWVIDDIGITARGDRRICPDCQESYYYCNECDEYVHEDEWDFDEDMCRDCAGEKLIERYHSSGHSTKKCIKIGDCLLRWRGVWRGLGVELEIEHPDGGDNSRDNTLAHTLYDMCDNIMFERDGSVPAGFEIITQPHTEKEFYNMPWAEMLNACKKDGYRSHDGGNCGLHIHLSREFFGANRGRQEAPIAKLIRFFDLYYNEIIKISRRNPDGAERWAQPSNTTSRKDALDIAKNKKYTGRYQAVNTTNARTVEIRIMRGTLNISTFYACVDFVLTVAKNSRKIKWSEVADAEKWLKGLKPETVEYIKLRNAFINII